MTKQSSLPTLHNAHVCVERTERVYQGFFAIDQYRLNHARFNGQTMPSHTREVFERGRAVAVLLFDIHTDQMILIEQFRVGALEDERSPWLLEIVAGMAEAGECDERVAIREVKEETGLSIDRVHSMFNYWVSPGGTSERVHVFYAPFDSKVAQTDRYHGLQDEHEDIKLHLVSFNQAYAWAEQGIINNGLTLLALQWLKLHHAALINGDVPTAAKHQETP